MCDMDPASTAAGVQYPPPTYMKGILYGLVGNETILYHPLTY